jgi:hypothetical protein
MHVPDIVIARQHFQASSSVQQVGKARVVPAIGTENRVANHIDNARPIINLRDSNEYKAAGGQLSGEHEDLVSAYHRGRSATHGAYNSVPGIGPTRAAKVFNVILVDGRSPTAIGKDGCCRTP